MKELSYQKTIIVKATAEKIYKALTKNIDGWWAKYTGNPTKVDELVTFHFHAEKTFWKMKMINLVPNKLVQWECVNAHHEHTGMPDTIREEWLGTKLIWRIKSVGEKTKILLKHEGLTPELGCYEICEAGWDHFFVKQLTSYLNNN